MALTSQDSQVRLCQFLIPLSKFFRSSHITGNRNLRVNHTFKQWGSRGPRNSTPKRQNDSGLSLEGVPSHILEGKRGPAGEKIRTISPFLASPHFTERSRPFPMGLLPQMPLGWEGFLQAGQRSGMCTEKRILSGICSGSMQAAKFRPGVFQTHTDCNTVTTAVNRTDHDAVKHLPT